MTKAKSEKAIRELDRRTSEGIDVRMVWNSVTGQVLVAVNDARSAESFELQVAPGDALFAFHHPYAYANGPAATGSHVA